MIFMLLFTLILAPHFEVASGTAWINEVASTAQRTEDGSLDYLWLNFEMGWPAHSDLCEAGDPWVTVSVQVWPTVTVQQVAPVLDASCEQVDPRAPQAFAAHVAWYLVSNERDPMPIAGAFETWGELEQAILAELKLYYGEVCAAPFFKGWRSVYGCRRTMIPVIRS